jgi:hypothetical protein
VYVSIGRVFIDSPFTPSPISISRISCNRWYPWSVVHRKLIGFEVSLQRVLQPHDYYETRQRNGNSTMALKPILTETTAFRLASSLITNSTRVPEQLVFRCSVRKQDLMPAKQLRWPQQLQRIFAFESCRMATALGARQLLHSAQVFLCSR